MFLGLNRRRRTKQLRKSHTECFSIHISFRSVAEDSNNQDGTIKFNSALGEIRCQ